MLKGLDKFPAEVTSSTKILFANMGSEELRYLIPVVKQLREAGVPCEIYPESSKLKKQFDYADRKKIPFISIVGETEAAEGLVNIKNLSSGEQKSFKKEDIASVFEFIAWELRFLLQAVTGAWLPPFVVHISDDEYSKI